jgi:hypothetical protein
MRGYRQTFRRHRLLFMLPPLIAAIALGVLGYSAGKTYESNASLWVDNAASSTSSLNVGPTNAQAQEPSTAEQTVLDELLSTSKFDAAVVSGAGLGTAGGVAEQHALDASIATDVTSSVPGPQVLELTYDSTSPVVAHAIVGSLVNQLQTWTSQFGRDFGDAAVAYDLSQEQTAERAVAGAKAAVNAYLTTHPRATTQTDQTYASLVAALSVSTSSLSSATTAYSQAKAQATGNGSGVTVSVIDAPSLDAAPLTGLKSVAMKAVGGLFAGLLLSFLVIVALTPSGEDKWDDEVVEGAARQGEMAALRTAPISDGFAAAAPSRAVSDASLERSPSSRSPLRVHEGRLERSANDGGSRGGRSWGIADQPAREERA